MNVGSCVNGAKFDLLANQFSEILGGLHGLQAAVKADRRLNIAVSKQPPHGLVVPRPAMRVMPIAAMCGLTRASVAAGASVRCVPSR